MEHILLGKLNEEDVGEDEAALIDSFFLPGGILDPEITTRLDEPDPVQRLALLPLHTSNAYPWSPKAHQEIVPPISTPASHQRLHSPLIGPSSTWSAQAAPPSVSELFLLPAAAPATSAPVLSSFQPMSTATTSAFAGTEIFEFDGRCRQSFLPSSQGSCKQGIKNDNPHVSLEDHGSKLTSVTDFREGGFPLKNGHTDHPKGRDKFEGRAAANCLHSLDARQVADSPAKKAGAVNSSPSKKGARSWAQTVRGNDTLLSETVQRGEQKTRKGVSQQVGHKSGPPVREIEFVKKLDGQGKYKGESSVTSSVSASKPFNPPPTQSLGMGGTVRRANNAGDAWSDEISSTRVKTLSYHSGEKLSIDGLSDQNHVPGVDELPTVQTSLAGTKDSNSDVRQVATATNEDLDAVMSPLYVTSPVLSPKICSQPTPPGGSSQVRTATLPMKLLTATTRVASITMAHISAMFIDFVLVISLSSRQLLSLLSSFSSYIINSALLLSTGAENAFLFAKEGLVNDGAFMCYAVASFTPLATDTLMMFVSLPIHIPHLLALVGCYFACLPNGNRRRKAKCNIASIRIAEDIGDAILRSIRFLLPLFFISEGFARKDMNLMMCKPVNRWLMAYMIALLRNGLILSPVGWTGYAIQIFLISYLRVYLLVDFLVLLTGVVFIHLTITVQ